MDRGTLASGSDLTWILPHWLNCLPLGVMSHVSVCACAWAVSPMNEWALWIKSCCWGEIIMLKWRTSSGTDTPSIPLPHPPVLDGANLNESHQRALWMKHTAVATLASSDRKGSLTWLFWHRLAAPHRYEYVLGLGYCKFKKMFSISVTLCGNNLYLLEFVFPLQAELSGFDDWPPIQQRVSKSDNEWHKRLSIRIHK